MEENKPTLQDTILDLVRKFRSECAILGKHIDDLGIACQAELDLEFQKDALRYRHLRNKTDEVPSVGLDVAFWEDCSGTAVRGENLDKLVDEEILKFAKENL